MKKVDKNLWVCTTADIKKSKPSDFGNGAVIYVKPNTKGDYKYIINLDKKGYKTYSLGSRVEDANTGKKLTTAGSKKGMRPYFIDDFLSR